MEFLNVAKCIMGIAFLSSPLSANQTCEGFFERWRWENCTEQHECRLYDTSENAQAWMDGKLVCNGITPDGNVFKCGNIVNVKEVKMEDCPLFQFNMKEFLHVNDPYKIYISYKTTEIRPLSVDFSGMSSLDTVIISGSRTGGNFNITFDKVNQISFLNIHDHDIVTFPTARFRDTSRLKVLRIENGKLKSLDGGTFTGLGSVKVLSVSVNLINRIDPAAFSELSSLRWLDLSRNRLNVIPNNTLDSLGNLQFIDLSFNFLEQLPLALTVLGNLLIADVRSNNLTTLPSALTNSSTNLQIALSGNDWNCDCVSCSLMKWIKDYEKNIIDYEFVMCNKYSEEFGKIVKLNVNNTTIEDLCKCVVKKKVWGIIIILVSSVVFLLLVAVPLIIWCRKYRSKIVEKEILPEEKTMYDAFVWHHDSDKKFVNLMIEKLEPEHRLFLLQRDWLSYEHAHDKVRYSMENSSFVILILSKNFISSELFQIHFRSFYHEMPAKRNVVVPIFLEDVPNEKALPPEFRHLWYLHNRLRCEDKSLWKKLLHLFDSRSKGTLL